MRQFSEFEKEIIKEIVSDKPIFYEFGGTNFASNSLGKILDELVGVIHIRQINDNRIQVIFLSTDRENEMQELFDFVFLVRYLEDEFFIGLSPSKTHTEYISNRYKKIELPKHIPESPDPPLFFGRRDKENILDSGIVTSTFSYSTSLGNELLRYAYSLYYPSQELKDLVANDFKSSEQIYVEKQLKEAKTQTTNARNSVGWAIATTILAFLTFLATVIIPIITK